jgi:hypothetical protein
MSTNPDPARFGDEVERGFGGIGELMTTRVDVINGIEAVDARVNELTPQLLTHADAELPEGEWHVREALCHLAARANSVPLATAAAQRARAAKSQGQAAPARGSINIDEINQRQIDDRRNHSIQELLDEIHAGHQTAVKAVREFDQPSLEERLPAFTGGGDMSFAELLLRAGPGHENNHLDQIVKAMGG